MGLCRAVGVGDDDIVVAVVVADKVRSLRKNHRHYFAAVVVVVVGKTNRQTRLTERTGWIGLTDSRFEAEAGALTFGGRTVPRREGETGIVESAAASAAERAHCRWKTKVPSKGHVAVVVGKEEAEYPAWAHQDP